MGEAVAKGIKVAAIQGSADCVKDTGALFYHGEDSTTAWEQVGKDMVKALRNKACKVGIITGFSATRCARTELVAKGVPAPTT